MKKLNISYIDANAYWKEQLGAEWGEIVARHMHLENGFAIVAVQETEPAGVISVRWQRLPPPLPETVEGYIDSKPYPTADFVRRLIGWCLGIND